MAFHHLCHISQSFLPYSSNSIFTFALSVLLAIATNLRPLDKTDISASERFLLENWRIFFLTFLISSLDVAILLILQLPSFSSISGVFSVVLIITFSTPSGLTKSEAMDSSWLAWEELLVLKTPLTLLIVRMVLRLSKSGNLEQPNNALKLYLNIILQI